VGNGFPALLSHKRAVPEFQVGNFNPFSGNGTGIADYEWLFPAAFQVDRDRFSPVMNGDLDNDLFDCAAPDGCNHTGVCPPDPFPAGFDCRDFNPERLIAAFGNQVIFHGALVIGGELDPADPGSAFVGYDRLHHENLRSALFLDPLVVTAGGTPDERVPGLGDHLVLGGHFAHGAVSGNNH
jgi:hypothetical protein